MGRLVKIKNAEPTGSCLAGKRDEAIYVVPLEEDVEPTLAR